MRSCADMYIDMTTIYFFSFFRGYLARSSWEPGCLARSSCEPPARHRRVAYWPTPSSVDRHARASTQEHSPHKLQHVCYSCVLCHVELHGVSTTRETVQHINCRYSGDVEDTHLFQPWRKEKLGDSFAQRE
nr:uncharacterized protein LOC126528376 [Dermacentor andersoni]